MNSLEAGNSFDPLVDLDPKIKKELQGGYQNVQWWWKELLHLMANEDALRLIAAANASVTLGKINLTRPLSHVQIVTSFLEKDALSLDQSYTLSVGQRYDQGGYNITIEPAEYTTLYRKKDMMNCPRLMSILVFQITMNIERYRLSRPRILINLQI